MAKCILEEYPDVDGIFAADMPAIAFLKAALAIGKRFLMTWQSWHTTERT